DTNDGTTPTAYFVETLTYAGEVTSTTSSSTSSTSSTSTTTSSTTSTSSTSTTSTTSTTTTPTTAPSPTPTPTHSSRSPPDPAPPSAVVPPVSSGTSSGPLAFTGASTRDLLSIGLVFIAVGLFLLGERGRRRGRT